MTSSPGVPRAPRVSPADGTKFTSKVAASERRIATPPLDVSPPGVNPNETKTSRRVAPCVSMVHGRTRAALLEVRVAPKEPIVKFPREIQDERLHEAPAKERKETKKKKTEFGIPFRGERRDEARRCVKEFSIRNTFFGDNPVKKEKPT